MTVGVGEMPKFPPLGEIAAPEAKRLLRAIATIILASIAEEEPPPKRVKRKNPEQRRRIERAEKGVATRKAKAKAKKSPKKKAKR